MRLPDVPPPPPRLKRQDLPPPSRALMARFEAGATLTWEERRYLRMTGPHLMSSGFYHYGPGLTMKETRGVPCYCCGERDPGALCLADAKKPDGVLVLCRKHGPLAYKDWDKMERLHRFHEAGPELFK